MPADILIKGSYKAHSIRKQLNKMVHKQFIKTISIHATQKNRFAAHAIVSKCNLNEKSRLEGVIFCVANVVISSQKIKKKKNRRMVETAPVVQ